MNDVKCAVLNVGGWYDAEDPVGPLRVYQSVEEKNPATPNLLVMGPWSHGGWGRGPGDRLGEPVILVEDRRILPRADPVSVLRKVPERQARGSAGGPDVPDRVRRWRRLESWPPKGLSAVTLYLDAEGRFVAAAPPLAPAGSSGFDEYVSDPAHPVPYVGYIAGGMTSDYMTEDQRFAAQRPDVLTYRTAVLQGDVVVAGPIKVRLNVSSTGSDSGFFAVKLIDVYPGATIRRPRPPRGRARPRTPGSSADTSAWCGASPSGRNTARASRSPSPWPRAARGDRVRASRCLPRLPQGPPADGPGPEFGGSPGRSQSAEIHGDPEGGSRPRRPPRGSTGPRPCLPRSRCGSKGPRT